MALLAYGLRRQIAVDRALDEGVFVPPDARVLAFLTGAAAVLGVLTVILTLLHVLIRASIDVWRASPLRVTFHEELAELEDALQREGNSDRPFGAGCDPRD